MRLGRVHAIGTMIAFLGVARVGAQAAPPVQADAPGLPEVSSDYSIGPRDLLDIRVFEIPELNLERRVTDAGTIDLPMLGDFSVAGLSAPQVRDKLQQMLTAKYVNRANVSGAASDRAAAAERRRPTPKGASGHTRRLTRGR